MTTLQSTSNPFMHHACANDDCVSTNNNHNHNRDHHRSRTVPIAATITPVANYPSKLVVYKIPASKYWQMRCFMHGRTHKQSTHTTNQRVALNTARAFYEQLCVQYHSRDIATAAGAAKLNTAAATKPQHTFAAMAAQMYANEYSRVQRGELSADSLQVLRNRLDLHILPTFGKRDIAAIDYQQLQRFVHVLSQRLSSTTVSQYMVAVRKVFVHAKQVGVIAAPPDMPRIKVVSASRSAFTPTEYWQIMRRARSLVGTAYPHGTAYLRQHYQVMRADSHMPPDLAWVIAFMVNSFIRPSDVKTLQHRHVEVVRNGAVQYLRLTLPETKRHAAPIVTLQPAVRIYQHMCLQRSQHAKIKPTDHLFLPQHQDRDQALKILSVMLTWVLEDLGLKQNAHGGNRTLYSFRHSAITFRLLYGSGIDLLTLARNARTSVEMIQRFYASTVQPEQNIRMLHSKRTRL
jgi:integrase